MGPDKKLMPGDNVPRFSLPDQDGKMVSLDDFLGRSKIVLFFYPKDESFGCTKEACSFRDRYEEFKEAGAVVIGISADNEASHRGFASRHRLPFILLSDRDRRVAKLFGVGKTMGIFPGRVTFILDEKGIIRGIYSSQTNYNKHVDEALEVIQNLKVNQ